MRVAFVLSVILGLVVSAEELMVTVFAPQARKRFHMKIKKDHKTPLTVVREHLNAKKLDIQPLDQQITVNGTLIADDNLTLREQGVKDGDILSVLTKSKRLSFSGVNVRLPSGIIVTVPGNRHQVARRVIKYLKPFLSDEASHSYRVSLNGVVYEENDELGFEGDRSQFVTVMESPIVGGGKSDIYSKRSSIKSVAKNRSHKSVRSNKSVKSSKSNKSRKSLSTADTYSDVDFDTLQQSSGGLRTSRSSGGVSQSSYVSSDRGPVKFTIRLYDVLVKITEEEAADMEHVADLKDAIEAQTGIPKTELALYLNGKMLDELRSLEGLEGVELECIRGGRDVPPSLEGDDFDSMDSVSSQSGRVSQDGAYKVRRYRTAMGLAIVLVLLVWVSKLIIDKALSAMRRDEFVRKFVESISVCYLYCLAVFCILEGIMQIDFVEKISGGYYIGQLAHVVDDTDVFSHWTTIYMVVDEIMLIFLYFLLLFTLYIVWTIITFMWNLNCAVSIDNSDVDEIIRGASRAKQEYVTLKYGFYHHHISTVIQYIDPSGAWFTRFVRAQAAIFHTKVASLNSYSLLVLLALGIFAGLLANASAGTEVFISVVCHGLLLGATIVNYYKLRSRYNKIIPRDPADYVKTMFDAEIEKRPITNEEISSHALEYKSQEISGGSRLSPSWIKRVYGTFYPTAFDNLFYFRRNGPDFLVWFTNLTVLLQLALTSYCLMLSRVHYVTWGEKYPYVILLCLIMAIANFAFLPAYAWRHALLTTVQPEYKTLSAVWGVERSGTTVRWSEFIGQIILESLFWNLRDPKEFEKAKEQVANMPEDAKEQNERIFKMLEYNNSKVVTSEQIPMFFFNQGVRCADSSKEVWEEALRIKGISGLGMEEFHLMVLVLKAYHGPLNHAAILAYLNHAHAIRPDGVMDWRRLQTLGKDLGVPFTEMYAKHMMERISQERCTWDVGVEAFVMGLNNIRSETLGALEDNITGLKDAHGQATQMPTGAPLDASLSVLL